MAVRYEIAPLWSGATAVIVGGGPSVTAKQIRTLGVARLKERCKVVAVNDAIYLAWWADWLHASDYKWWHWHQETAPRFQGIKTTLSETVPNSFGVGWLQSTGQLGFDPDPSRVRAGGNGVYQSVHNCIHAGVSRILLVGVDMKEAVDGSPHFFGEHPDRIRPNYAEVMIAKFPSILPTLKERKIQIFNCSPGSALTCIPQGNLESLI